MLAVAILAVVALLVDLAIYIASYVCVDPRDWFRPEWAALLGFYLMFAAVLLPANIVETRREKRAKMEGRELPTENPLWFKPVTWLVTAWMLFHFFVVGFTVIHKGDPVSQGGGTYALDPGHGHPLIPVSEAEYHRLRRLGVRAGSGFFLGVYIAIASDLMLTLTGQKRFKLPDQAVRRFSLVVIGWRRFGGD